MACPFIPLPGKPQLIAGPFKKQFGDTKGPAPLNVLGVTNTGQKINKPDLIECSSELVLLPGELVRPRLPAARLPHVPHAPAPGVIQFD
jgi:hypothetical protein